MARLKNIDDSVIFECALCKLIHSKCGDEDLVFQRKFVQITFYQFTYFMPNLLVYGYFVPLHVPQVFSATLHFICVLLFQTTIFFSLVKCNFSSYIFFSFWFCFLCVCMTRMRLPRYMFRFTCACHWIMPLLSPSIGYAFHAETAKFYKIITDTFSERSICELSEIPLFGQDFNQQMMTIVQQGSPLRKMITYG